MSAAHENAHGVIVEILFRAEFARLGKHAGRVKQACNEVKRWILTQKRVDKADE